jgi:DNA-binding GntR family transcriptional regulator
MPVSAPTKFELVYELVRARIDSGEYAPGRRLSFRALGRECATSDIPVREAIHRLAAEGRVVYRPRQPVVVADVTLGAVHELLLPAAILEGAITRLAARHVSPDVVEQLAEIVAGQRAAAASDEPAAFARLSVRFHDLLAALCPARGRVDTAESIRERTRGLRQISPSMYTSQSMAERLAEHELFLRLLDERPLNLDRVEAFARGHKLRFFLAIVEGESAAEVRRAELSTVWPGAPR